MMDQVARAVQFVFLFTLARRAGRCSTPRSRARRTSALYEAAIMRTLGASRAQMRRASSPSSRRSARWRAARGGGRDARSASSSRRNVLNLHYTFNAARCGLRRACRRGRHRAGGLCRHARRAQRAAAEGPARGRADEAILRAMLEELRSAGISIVGDRSWLRSWSRSHATEACRQARDACRALVRAPLGVARRRSTAACSSICTRARRSRATGWAGT